MKSLFTYPVLVLSGIFLSTGVFAEDARSIFNSFEAQKAEALAAYLEANPEAEDTGLAESMLVGSYMQLDEPEKAAPLLRKRYDSLSKGADANLQELIPGVIEPLFRVYTGSGDKDAAREFVEQAKKDLSGHP
ncbi:MAG: hypothetical protein AAGF67_07190, partial [Verrucomicrobiota bacterium]